MSTRTRIPPLLDACIRLPPESSLLLLTGVISASPHWITTRFLSRLLGNNSNNNSSDDDDVLDADRTGVVLVSWMREREFWRTEARRGVVSPFHLRLRLLGRGRALGWTGADDGQGLDLARAEGEGRFAFVYGLTGLFSGLGGGGLGIGSGQGGAAARLGGGHQGGAAATTAGMRGQMVPERAPLGRAPPAAMGRATPPTRTTAQKDGYTLTSPSLTAALEIVSQAVAALQAKNKHVFLVLDAPTLLLAANPTVSATDLALFVLRLRALVHSTLLVVEADAPLIAAAAPDAFLAGRDYLSAASTMQGKVGITPLEKDHAGFVVGQAHLARCVIGTRGLDTGVAKDVSGVLTVRRGGTWDEQGEEVVQMEVLYRVLMDGNVRVFERGAGDIG
ncbi:hypothetical protein ANO11243_083980 [Dothideomycetidae sp. 11243]|nr:hypothetical protein ANO11243_083980 [fungal sp. No.11243]